MQQRSFTATDKLETMKCTFSKSDASVNAKCKILISKRGCENRKCMNTPKYFPSSLISPLT